MIGFLLTQSISPDARRVSAAQGVLVHQLDQWWRHCRPLWNDRAPERLTSVHVSKRSENLNLNDCSGAFLVYLAKEEGIESAFYSLDRKIMAIVNAFNDTQNFQLYPERTLHTLVLAFKV